MVKMPEKDEWDPLGLLEKTGRKGETGMAGKTGLTGAKGKQSLIKRIYCRN